jgi:hypothetical protein
MNRTQCLYKWLYQETSEWSPGYWGEASPICWSCAAWLPAPYGSAFSCRPIIRCQFGRRWRSSVRSHRLSGYIGIPGKSVYGLLLLVDVVVFFTAYWQTHRPESDFFLFYCLPIFTAAEYLSWRWVMVAFFGFRLAFACVIFGMPTDAATGLQSFLSVFLPREVFFIAMSLVWALRLRRERDSRQAGD